MRRAVESYGHLPALYHAGMASFQLHTVGSRSLRAAASTADEARALRRLPGNRVVTGLLRQPEVGRAKAVASLGPAVMLGLQRMAGNRAVAGLVASSRADPAPQEPAALATVDQDRTAAAAHPSEAVTIAAIGSDLMKGVAGGMHDGEAAKEHLGKRFSSLFAIWATGSRQTIYGTALPHRSPSQPVGRPR